MATANQRYRTEMKKVRVVALDLSVEEAKALREVLGNIKYSNFAGPGDRVYAVAVALDKAGVMYEGTNNLVGSLKYLDKTGADTFTRTFTGSLTKW